MPNDADPQSVVSLLIKSELQYDYDAQVSPFAGDSLSVMSMTVSRDKERYLNVYYIQGNSIFNAYQTHNNLPTGSPPWSVENTRFESTNATPTLVRSLGLIGPGRADWISAVSTTNDIYLLDTSKKYPSWQKLPLLDPDNAAQNADILDVRLYLASDTIPYISVLTMDNRMFLLSSDSLNYDGWYEDTSVNDLFGSGALAFASSGAFARQFNSTTFGYLIAGAEGTSGLTILTGTPYTSHGFISNKVTVDPGTSYGSVWIASMPAFTAPSYPLLFAVDNAFNAYYFQVKDAKGAKFLKVPIFSGIKVKELTASFRTNKDPTSGAVSMWAEVFAMDASGTTYHMESLADNLVQLKNGHYTVQEWGSYSPLSSGATAIAGAVSYDGMAYMVEYGQSESAVKVRTQDPTTTDWKINAVALPAPLATSTQAQVTKQHAYYIEATVVDGNRIPIPGRAAVVSSSQHAVININGHVKSIDSVHTTTALTNGAGQISFTLLAEGSLSIPVFSLWAEGMDINHVVDVKPNGPIQSRLVNMTLQEARQARNQDDPNQPLLFPTNEYTDDDVNTALTAMKNSLKITDPTFTSERNYALHAIDHTSFARKYLHPITHSAVARTRLRTARSLAHISGRADFGVEITFYPKLHVRTFNPGDGPSDKFSEFSLWSKFTGSLGDLWNGVKNGAHQVVNAVIDTIKDGVSAAIKFIKDGAQYIWNGIVHVVEMGFHLVDIVFNSVKKAFKAVFGWLGLLFEMGSINRSADKFKQVLLDFPNFAQAFFGTTLPNVTLGSGTQVKAWLTTAFDSVENLLGGKTVGQYADPGLLPRGGSYKLQDAASQFGSSDGQSVLDSLPSSALWLINKIFNAAGGGNAGQITFSKSLRNFNALWDKFWAQLEAVGLQVDLKQAASDLYKSFTDFRLRSVFDGTCWVDLLKVVKDVVFLMIDVYEGLAIAVENLIAEAINFFVDLLNLPLDLPVISPIFKAFTGHDFTVINMVAYIVAVPFTFMYKLITGSKPFENSVQLSSAGKPEGDVLLSTSQSLNIAKGVVMILRTYYLTAVSTVQEEGDIWLTSWMGFENDIFPPFLARIINGISFCVPIICFGLAGYPTLDNPSVGSIVGWGAELIPAGLILFHVIRSCGVSTVSQNSKLGDIVVYYVGVGKLCLAIYETITLPSPFFDIQSSTSNDALIASYWFKPWPNFAQPLRLIAMEMDPVDAQWIVAAQVVIKQVCGLGEAVSFIVANST
ncbi:hypothetical protein HYDPIDRAFT_28855 [Hydnomerulius pinastri MD-312]|uniref:Uncharacterized protein n=1 Tax=Hydnomerulius pinastri MD-312 TaxID=994086 RepID=A0A0C9W8Q8_9AGAM|nr:hypothetical protein HYDPIDRAFT_28855 [Hydnomerulius pinastri MD-312]